MLDELKILILKTELKIFDAELEFAKAVNNKQEDSGIYRVLTRLRDSRNELCDKLEYLSKKSN
tara:strand:+ start:383 stop:571 length:189 start_codon:yes stop_codon:yes gene_type:complete